MSFRTERSVVKNLGYIHVYASEILRFALNDKGVNFSLKFYFFAAIACIAVIATML